MEASSPISSSQNPEYALTDEKVVVTGLGTEWPSLLVHSEHFKEYVSRLYSTEDIWLRALLRINRQTGIHARAVVDFWNEPKWNASEVPSMNDVDGMYRKHAVPLAVKAIRKALEDSSMSSDSITHMVSVTATNAGSPGFDALVAKELSLSGKVERLLLNGVGCAGGMTALRTASAIAYAANYEGREARILVVACELCSIQIRAELHASSTTQEVGIGPALFSDGAAALIVCNRNGLKQETPCRYSIINHQVRTDTSLSGEMIYRATSNGFLLHLSKQVADFAVESIREPYESLLQSCGMSERAPEDFDWALHPGVKQSSKAYKNATD